MRFFEAFCVAYVSAYIFYYIVIFISSLVKAIEKRNGKSGAALFVFFANLTVAIIYATVKALFF